jgi:hypothetical protein
MPSSAVRGWTVAELLGAGYQRDQAKRLIAFGNAFTTPEPPPAPVTGSTGTVTQPPVTAARGGRAKPPPVTAPQPSLAGPVSKARGGNGRATDPGPDIAGMSQSAARRLAQEHGIPVAAKGRLSRAAIEKIIAAAKAAAE